MPYKVWAVGEEVLAADFNTYVQQQTINAFPSLAALKSAIPTPPDGLHAYLLDECSEVVGKAGTWRWWRKQFPITIGNSQFVTFNSFTVPASSSANVALDGLTMKAIWTITLATPAANGANAAGSVAAPFRPVVACEGVASCFGSGNPGGARVLVRTTANPGDLYISFAVTTLTATTVVAHTAYLIADLITA